MQQHALTEGLLGAMEEWAAKQPAALPDALEAVERISELLDLSGLFSALLLHPRRDRLAPEPSLGHLNADTKGDFLELTLAAAAQVLDCAEKPCSEPLMRCLHAARLLIEDAARTLEELQLWGNPLLLRVTREVDGCSVSCKSCPKCGGAVFGQWRYATWGGLLAAVGAHAC